MLLRSCQDCFFSDSTRPFTEMHQAVSREAARDDLVLAGTQTRGTCAQAHEKDLLERGAQLSVLPGGVSKPWSRRPLAQLLHQGKIVEIEKKIVRSPLHRDPCRACLCSRRVVWHLLKVAANASLPSNQMAKKVFTMCFEGNGS